MRAVRLHGIRDLRVDELDQWKPSVGEALIRVEACGVCPSEVRSFTGARAGSSYEHQLPRVLGHEWAGTVAEVGPPGDDEGTTAFGVEEGQRVAVDWRCVCGTCPSCHQGRFDLCERLSNCVRGGFVEYGVAPLSQLRVVPAHVSGEEAAFTEPLACVLNGHRVLAVEPGDDVVVVGAGPMGLLHAQVAIARGARVIVCDPVAERCDAATELGAHEVVNETGEEAVAAVKGMTDGRGADAVVVAVGAIEAIRQGLSMAGPAGRVNLFAGTFPAGELSIDPNGVHYPQLVVTGTHDYTPRQFTAAARLISLGTIRVAPLISHRGSLDEVTAAFERIIGHQGLKTVILPHT